MTDRSFEFDPLDQLAEEFVARHRRGEEPALSEYADCYPDYAEAIRSLFPALLKLDSAPPCRSRPCSAVQ
jgi:hypothetical protein